MDGEWDRLALGALTVNHDSKRVPVKEADRKTGPYPYYGASGIVDYIEDFIFDGEYLLIAEDGENLRTRKTPVAFLARGKFWVNNHAHIVTGNERAITRFIHYALQSADISRYITGAVMPKLTQRSLNQIEIPVPQLAEQERIVNLLGALDGKIELNRRMAATLEETARALFQSWFVDFDPVWAKAEGRNPGLPDQIAALFPDSFGADGLPEGWKVGSPAELAEVNPRTPIGRNQPVPYVDMAALPTTGTRVASFVMREAGSGARFQNGDTLLARITPCLENGKTALVDCLAPGETGWGSTEFIVLRPRPGVPPSLPYLIARSEKFRVHMIAAMSGTSGRQRVSAEAVERWGFAIPPAKVLDVFGGMAEPLFSSITKASRQAATLSEIRDTLLPRLLSGELRIAEAAKEAAAA